MLFCYFSKYLEKVLLLLFCYFIKIAQKHIKYIGRIAEIAAISNCLAIILLCNIALISASGPKNGESKAINLKNIRGYTAYSLIHTVYLLILECGPRNGGGHGIWTPLDRGDRAFLYPCDGPGDLCNHYMIVYPV